MKYLLLILLSCAAMHFPDENPPDVCIEWHVVRNGMEMLQYQQWVEADYWPHLRMSCDTSYNPRWGDLAKIGHFCEECKE